MILRPSLWPSSRSSTLCSFCRRHQQLRAGSNLTRHGRSLVRLKPPGAPRRYSESVAAPYHPKDLAAHQTWGLPFKSSPELQALMTAVQSQDLVATTDALERWTNLVRDEESPECAAAEEEIANLPGPVFSEILRSVDPFLTASQDIAHGMYISFGETRATNVGQLINEYGIRSQYHRVFAALVPLVYIRARSPNGYLEPDQQVVMRCAGATMDRTAVNFAYHHLVGHEKTVGRTSKTFTEFLKALFVVDPLYWHYDRAMVAVQPRDRHSVMLPLRKRNLLELDRLRFSINSRMLEPWGRVPSDESLSLGRVLRRRRTRKGFHAYFSAAVRRGLAVDEEVLCVALVAYARAFSYHIIHERILALYYGITIHQTDTPGLFEVTGGHNFHPEDPIRPTARLLDAIVEAFSTMGQIGLALRLVDFVSRRYDTPIPSSTWSNLLGWTYVLGSKLMTLMNKLSGREKFGTVQIGDTSLVWDIMTSEPYNVAPGFAEYDWYIRGLIVEAQTAPEKFDKVIHIIRTDVMPFYASVMDEFDLAVADEILQTAAAAAASGPAPRRATLRRRRAERAKDHTHYRMSVWFLSLARYIGKVDPAARPGGGGGLAALAGVTLPNLVLEFGDFFPRDVTYRVENGLVRLHRGRDAVPRSRYVVTERLSMPSRESQPSPPERPTPKDQWSAQIRSMPGRHGRMRMAAAAQKAADAQRKPSDEPAPAAAAAPAARHGKDRFYVEHASPENQVNTSSGDPKPEDDHPKPGPEDDTKAEPEFYTPQVGQPIRQFKIRQSVRQPERRRVLGEPLAPGHRETEEYWRLLRRDMRL